MSPTRTLRALLLGAALLGVLAASAQAAAPRAELRDWSCVRALDPLSRGLTVTAVMRPVPGTQSMSMRFDLLRAASAGGRWRSVHGSNLGRWLSPPDASLGQRAADVWKVSHPVVSLPAPAFYRLRVSFRWLAANRRQLSALTLTTPTCHQLELRPDLAVRSVAAPVALAAPAGDDRYVAVIRNQGATAAGPFDVQLSVPGSMPVSTTVSRLGAHSQRRVAFVAPACHAGDPITVSADPQREVDDFAAANNQRTITCRPPASSTARTAARAPLHSVKQ